MEIHPRTADVDDMRARATSIIVRLYDYWNDSLRGWRMPSRSDIDSEDTLAFSALACVRR